MSLGSGLRVLLAAGLLMLVTGCRHKVKVAAIPLPPPTTVPLVPAPEPATPPRLPTEPVSPAPLPTQPVQPKVKKPKKKPEVVPVTPAPVAPVVVASVAPPPDASVIGALTAGGDASPEQRQKASDAIGEVEKRLAGLSTDTLKNQETGIVRVKFFLKGAHDALGKGDAEGSITLATKAKVLLDDLLK